MHYGYWHIERLKVKGEWIQSESPVLPCCDINRCFRCEPLVWKSGRQPLPGIVKVALTAGTMGS